MTSPHPGGNVSRMKPRAYDRDDVTAQICARLAVGDPMTVVCRDLDIPVRTVNTWRQDDAEIAARFDEARDLGRDAIAHRARATARGKGEAEGGDSTGDVQRDRLIIDTDFKLLAKWDPRRYGEKMTLSGDPESPLVKESDEQLDARIAALMAKRGEA